MKKTHAIGLTIFLLFLVSASFLPVLAHAQLPTNTPPNAPGSCSGDVLSCIRRDFAGSKLARYNSFADVILDALRIALALIGAVSSLFIIVGGFQYVGARGNEEAQEAAKKTLTGAIIGLAFALLAFAIVSIVSRVLLEGPKGLGF